MFQESPLERENRNKSIIDEEMSIKIRDRIYKILLKLTKTKVKYKIVKDNPFKKIDGHPIILAANHSRFQDTPIMCQVLKDVLNERGYIFAGKQRLSFINNLFFFLYGSIFFDRKDKADMKKAQEAMEKYLGIGKTIIEFPEGTWNLTDELLMLPMKWGITKSAQKTDSQIIPTILNYNDESMECHVRFLNPVLVHPDANIKEEIDNLRDSMGFARLDYMNKTIVRDDMNIIEEKEYKDKILKECGDYDLEYEQSIIYKPYSCPDEVFDSIKKLQLKRENAFLFYKHNQGMR